MMMERSISLATHIIELVIYQNNSGGSRHRSNAWSEVITREVGASNGAKDIERKDEVSYNLHLNFNVRDASVSTSAKNLPCESGIRYPHIIWQYELSAGCDNQVHESLQQLVLAKVLVSASMPLN